MLELIRPNMIEALLKEHLTCRELIKSWDVDSIKTIGTEETRELFVTGVRLFVDKIEEYNDRIIKSLQDGDLVDASVAIDSLRIKMNDLDRYLGLYVVR